MPKTSMENMTGSSVPTKGLKDARKTGMNLGSTGAKSYGTTPVTANPSVATSDRNSRAASNRNNRAK